MDPNHRSSALKPKIHVKSQLEHPRACVPTQDAASVNILVYKLRVNNVFINQFGISGFPETWITEREL